MLIHNTKSSNPSFPNDETELMVEVKPNPIQADDKYHHYTGNRIPWFVRLMWLGFWVFAISYTILYLFPALQRDLFAQ